jgi:AraC-like DNA-binding protein
VGDGYDAGEMTAHGERALRQMQVDREELAERIARALPRDGRAEPQPGLLLGRSSRTTELTHGFHVPAFCVIAQGAKSLTLGGDTFRYDPAHYMVSTVGLPMSSRVVEASVARPFLNLRVVLDPSVVASVMVESGLAEPRGGTGGNVKAIDVSPMDGALINATVRLIRLIDQPGEYRALGPLVVREIVYRLLSGPQAARMRHLATSGGRARRMVRAVETLRANFDKPLRIEAMAKRLGMSASVFHAHFKAVTAMSPLQYQKHLRLQEARRLMVSESCDAAEAGYRVGYQDASHFNREYKRHFGEPPMRDVERLRELAMA